MRLLKLDKDRARYICRMKQIVTEVKFLHIKNCLTKKRNRNEVIQRRYTCIVVFWMKTLDVAAFRLF